MIDIMSKIKSVIKDLENEYGPITFCAIFLRNDDFDKWDFLISASWLNTSEMQSYKSISSQLRKWLSDAELNQFSRIVILNQDDPVVSYFLGLETISNGSFKELPTDELSDKFKFTIKKAYLLRSQKLS